MFSLLSGFFSWLFEKEEQKILIVGVDHAGKTVRSLLLRSLPCAATQTSPINRHCWNR